MNKEDKIRNKIKSLKEEKKIIDNKIYNLRIDRSKAKKDNNYDKYYNINNKINTLRNRKSNINKEISNLNKKLIGKLS